MEEKDHERLVIGKWVKIKTLLPKKIVKGDSQNIYIDLPADYLRRKKIDAQFTLPTGAYIREHKEGVIRDTGNGLWGITIYAAKKDMDMPMGTVIGKIRIIRE